MGDELLTRAEAAKLLRVSPSQLAHGWGPPPLPAYKRPVMYSRRTIRRWLREQEALCPSTSAVGSGGSSSNTLASGTVSPRARQILEKQRRKRVVSALKSKTRRVLEVVR